MRDQYRLNPVARDNTVEPVNITHLHARGDNAETKILKELKMQEAC